MTNENETLSPTPYKLGGSKLVEYPETFEKWLRGEDFGPLAMEISATGGCNHGCLHCSYQQFVPYEQRKSFISREAFFSFLRDFKEMGGTEIFFAGKGEPLLNPDLHDYLKAGSDLGIDMVMSSNGVPLAERKMQSLMPFLKWVRFSVNGGDSESYARIHQCDPKEFDKLERNLTAAAEYRDKLGLRVKLAIQFIVYDLNIEAARGILDLHKRCGTDFLFIRNVSDRDGRFVKASQEIEDFLKEADNPPSVQVRWETFRELGTGRKWSKCNGVNFRANMDHEGNIYPCSRNHVMPSVVGNIHKSSFKEIWLSETRKALTRDIGTGAYMPLCAQWCDCAADNVYSEARLAEIGARIKSA